MYQSLIKAAWPDDQIQINSESTWLYADYDFQNKGFYSNFLHPQNSPFLFLTAQKNEPTSQHS